MEPLILANMVALQLVANTDRYLAYVFLRQIPLTQLIRNKPPAMLG